MKNYLGEIITALVTALAGLGAWSHERKQRREEIKKQQTNNIQIIVDLYQEALSDLKLRYDANLADLKVNYDFKFQTLETDLKKLRDSVNLWKNKYITLKNEFHNYKAKQENK